MSSGQGKKPFLRKCKEVFLKMDLFSNSELLKYKGEGSYQTYTGSTISVIISVLFFAIFYNYCKQTVQGKITSTPKTRPSLSAPFNTNESSSAFMFAVGIEGLDLTVQNKFFNIVMSSKVYKNGVEASSQRTPLEPCLLQQWEGINDQFKKTYSRLNFKHWLCPPKNHNFTFKGKYTSQQFYYTKIVVHRCQAGTSTSCASQEDFNNLLISQKILKLSIYFANPIIDASEKEYMDYVLEDTNFFEFTDLVGVTSHIFFSEYEVNTDRSVYPEPFNDVVTERGLTLNQRPVVSNFEVINTDELVRIYLRKSDLIQQFDRSYTRFDATFAYLGGLFGMVLMLFYGMRAFSEYAFEFQIGSHLFVDNDQEGSEFDSEKFHILRFPLYIFYCIVTFFYEPAQKWSCFDFEDKVDKCRQEVKQQTNVCQLIKRVLFMEKLLTLMCHREMNQLNIDNKWTIDEARQMRNLYKKEAEQNREKIKNFILATEDKAAKRRQFSRAKTKTVQRAAPQIRQLQIDLQGIIIQQRNEERLEAPDFDEGGQQGKISMKKEYSRQYSLRSLENDVSSNMEFNMKPLRQSAQQNIPSQRSKTSSQEKKGSSPGSRKDLFDDQQNISPDWSRKYRMQHGNNKAKLNYS